MSRINYVERMLRLIPSLANKVSVSLSPQYSPCSQTSLCRVIVKFESQVKCVNIRSKVCVVVV